MNPTQFPRIALVIPTYNAEQDIPKLLPAIMKQSLKPDHILVIDSSSSDNTQKLLSTYPVKVHTIKQSEFDHGGTRKLGTTLVDADIYIYLTQDAFPADIHSFKEIVTALCADEKIGCAYGRQLPKNDATPLSEHARLFNYPATSSIKSYSDKSRYGIKTCFNSDSFSAYKKDLLEEVGNFPNNLITGEDAYIAAKLLQHGHSIVYAADATVFHSHNLSLREEFHRYFSIGVFHSREKWMLHDFNGATGEGWRFVKSEINFLIQKNKLHWLPMAFVSTLIKYTSYQLGLHENKIPFFIKKKIGINKSFWLKDMLVTA